MRLTPDAIVDDGWLDLLTVDPLRFGAALSRLPRLFDGRLFGTTPVTVTIVPGALRALDCRPATSEVAGFSRANS